MSKENPVNHLNESFYITPKIARQIMTFTQWQETALVTQCRILSCGETYELTSKPMGGGMYEIKADHDYWKGGKPQKAKAKG